jgi:hypothetical protein
MITVCVKATCLFNPHPVQRIVLKIWHLNDDGIGYLFKAFKKGICVVNMLNNM